MRGGAVFLVFFVLFTLATLAVPVPLFPGNLLPGWFGLTSGASASLFSAVANGFTYGLVIWLVFIVATRGLDESGVADVEKGKNRSQRNNKRRAVKQ